MYKKKTSEAPQGEGAYRSREQGRYPIQSQSQYPERSGAPRRRTPPPPRAPKENIQITLETEVPAMPEKHQILGKPNWEGQYKKDFEAYENEIRKLKVEKVTRERREDVGESAPENQ